MYRMSQHQEKMQFRVRRGDETNETEAIDTVTTDVTEARELYMRTMSSSL